jgi:predicted nucleotidyltransferase
MAPQNVLLLTAMETIIEQHLPAIRQMLRQYGVEQAYLFGSAAKGIMHESSDVDFIIRFPKNMHYTTFNKVV